MAGRAQPIYVEIEIRGPIERVWELTQTPELHQRWDLRFTEITYHPRPDVSQPQQFDYATRIGFGIQIRGQGESMGSHEADGRRSSALKFWSDDRKSLITLGSGYWKYASIGTAPPIVRFLTAFDYGVRFGRIGGLFDWLVFRRLFGWATAWSFDRLRLWIEKGIEPEASLRRSVVNFTARLTLAIVWTYHGLVPKLLFRNADELQMIRDTGIGESSVVPVCVAIGVAELLVGIALLVFWHAKWPLWLTIAAMPIAMLVVALRSPAMLVAAFNPVTLNLCVTALAISCLLDLPSARRCVRKKSGGIQ